MKVTLVIPAYNEASHMPQLLNSIPAVVDEVIVVDDGSTDGTATVVENNGATLVQHPTNRGKGIAMLSGIKRLQVISSFSWMLTCSTTPKTSRSWSSQSLTVAQIYLLV